MITVLEVLRVTRESAVAVYRNTETNEFSHFDYRKPGMDSPIQVKHYPEQATIVYDEPIPASARKVINEYCKAYDIPRKRALYATAIVELLSEAYTNLEQIVAYRSNPSDKWQHRQRMNMCEMIAAVKHREIDKYRWLLEELDPIFLEQYDDYRDHVMKERA